MAGNAPVIVGVGHLANKADDVIVHPVDLLEAAARLALDDVGADVVPYLGAVLATPLSVFTEDDGAALVADRLGAPPGQRIESRYSGAAPQRLLADACRAITDGRIDAALIVGGVAEASVRRARRRGVELPAPPTSPWSQGSGGTGERLRLRPGSYRRTPESAAGGGMPLDFFALLESVFANRAGRGGDAHRVWLGSLLSPFTEVAAENADVAWFPVRRAPDELSAISGDNRLTAEPYTKRMVSFPTVDLAAAIVVVSEALADRLDVADARRVHPRAIAAVREPQPPSGRVAMHRSDGLHAAVERALDLGSIAVDDVATFDLYSCFPAAVQVGADALGIDPLDPRRLTVTGGLPYFGGPGASYSAHAIVCTVERCRTAPGSIGAVVGLGGLADDFAVGLYSTERGTPPFAFDDCADVTAQLDRTAVPTVEVREGVATVEAMTVLHGKDRGPTAAPVVARFDDGVRIGARAADEGLVRELAGRSLVGERVRLTEQDGHMFYVPA